MLELLRKVGPDGFELNKTQNYIVKSEYFTRVFYKGNVVDNFLLMLAKGLFYFDCDVLFQNNVVS